jgi:adenylylsulfate kinase-like enzyme
MLQGVEFERSRLTAAERWERNGHRPATIWLTARLDLAYLLERELFDRGCHVHVLSDDVDSHMLPELAKLSCAAGLITICSVAYSEFDEIERAKAFIGDDLFIYVNPESLSSRDAEAAAQVAALLERSGIVAPDERGISGDGI